MPQNVGNRGLSRAHIHTCACAHARAHDLASFVFCMRWVGTLDMRRESNSKTNTNSNLTMARFEVELHYLHGWCGHYYFVDDDV